MSRQAGVAIATALVIASCGVSSGQKFPIENARNIRPGVTDKAAVVRYLGQPVGRNNIYGKETWQYSSLNIGTNMGPQAFVPIVGPFLPGAVGSTSDSRSVTVEFNGDIVARCTLYTSSSA